MVAENAIADGAGVQSKNWRVHSVAIVLVRAILASSLLLVASAATARDFQTCKQVFDYLSAIRPDDQYGRIEDLRSAVALIDRASASGQHCDDHVVERVLFELGAELEAYSQTFRDREPQKTWSAQAAEAFEEYLSWFLSLPEESRDKLVRTLLRTSEASEGAFRRERGRWLRKRVGGALNTLGVAYVRSQNHEQLLTSYERWAREGIEIFPNEVVRRWHKFLRSKPEFSRDKRDAEIQELILDASEVRGQWEAFRGFLQEFVQLNPSVLAEWQGISRRIDRWLSEQS